jgi:hypothetical protein
LKGVIETLRWIGPAVAIVGCGTVGGLFIASLVPDIELRKTLYTGATGLLFGGFLGGALKFILDDLAAARREREDAAATARRKQEDAAGFVSNVLADLKDVYDHVGRAQLLIPAHRSVRTYGEEMRGLIEARVKLRNVVRALERRADGVTEETRNKVTAKVQQMEAYLTRLVEEFTQEYKSLSDKQRGYEERSRVLLKSFAERKSDEEPPTLPAFVWESIAKLPELRGFIERERTYEERFDAPLDEASQYLRDELAFILQG